jgi:chromate transporter
VSGGEPIIGSWPVERVSLATIAGQWLRLGSIGFGGPPTHIALLRRLCVEERKWIDASEFEDAIATTNLLPGPASTQLAIYCAWRLRGAVGAILGGICFIVPGLVLIVALSAVFLATHPPGWILGAAAGAGAAVPAVALHAARGLVPASWKRIGTRRAQHARWVVYALLGAAAAAMIGPYLVLVLLACGLTEILVRRRGAAWGSGATRSVIPAAVLHVGAIGGLGALAWVALKVGALSYGGGFVIIPLMQHDA